MTSRSYGPDRHGVLMRGHPMDATALMVGLAGAIAFFVGTEAPDLKGAIGLRFVGFGAACIVAVCLFLASVVK
jgi:hypothetical protein